jgi:hypothetical protein
VRGDLAQRDLKKLLVLIAFEGTSGFDELGRLGVWLGYVSLNVAGLSMKVS